MSKTKRREKAARRMAEFHKRGHGPKRRCINCLVEHTDSGHYAPPGLGSAGGFICERHPSLPKRAGSGR